MELTKLIAALTPEEVLGDLNHCIDRIEYDSRKAGPDTLFICLPGARFDGHSFAAQVYENGCRAFLCEHKIDALPTNAVQIITQNTRRALALLGRTFYNNSAAKLKLIGITGTKGKTTTAVLISNILTGSGIPCAYIGSNGVVINGRHYDTVNTTPESLELHRYFHIMEEEGVTHCVMEVSSQALTRYRVLGLSFEIVLFTNLSPDHISAEEHPTFEDYRDAKRLLFTDYSAKFAIVNADDPYSEYMIQGIDTPVVTYAVHSEADFTGSNIVPFRSETALGIDFFCRHEGQLTDIRLRTPGEFSVYNGLCAIACTNLLGVSTERAVSILRTTSISGRFEIVDAIPGITFLLDYAHNGLSLTSALRYLREYNPKRLICVFGAIGGRAQNRREELAVAASRLADYSIITSDNPNYEDPEEIIRDVMNYFDQSQPHKVIIDREEAVRHGVRMAEPGDIVLLAGKGHETYQLIRGEKVPFSERQILLEEAELIKKEQAVFDYAE